LLEDTSEKGGIITRLFRTLDKRQVIVVTSTVTLLEILVHPYRKKDTATVDHYYAYLTRAPFMKLIPLSAAIADRAAQLRAIFGFKTPDAIQLATALDAEATLFLTRDIDFRKQKEIEVGIL
jgi:predicted nucleic acid-binding protein